MKLLEPLTINGMRLPNRILVPAMVTRLSGEDGRAYDASGRASPPSNSVAVEPEVPVFGDAAESKDPEALHG
jgi:hypothetical protein